MRIANRTLVLATSVAAVGILLTACSSDSSSSTSASPTNSASASESTGNSVVAPIEVTGAGNLNVTTTDATTIATNNTSVLKVTGPRTEGGASFNGGAVLVGQGTAKLTVSGDSGVLYVVNVTAEGRVPSVSPGDLG
ncbi:MAG: hypothetical protein WBO42_02655 [Candidatus Nanopelagicales bacterium]